MREVERKKTQNNNQIKRPAREQKRDNKPPDEKVRKKPIPKETESKASKAKPVANTVVNDIAVSTEPPEVYENVVVHYLDDDVYRSEDALQDHVASVKVNYGSLDCNSALLEKEADLVEEEDSESERVKDSSSSQGDSQAADDESIKGVSRVPKKLSKKNSSQVPHASRVSTDTDRSKSNSSSKKPIKFRQSRLSWEDSSSSKSNNMDDFTSQDPEGLDGKSIKEVEEETFEDACNGAKNTESDDEIVNSDQDRATLNEKIERMEKRIVSLEEELREVAALEISLYSITAEHGSSAHKVHTPARRLSRLYIHACKHWTQNKRATVARNTVSGLILVARTCGNDVPRLTYWLSNTVVLREIISQAFGSSCQISPLKMAEFNGNGKQGGRTSSSLKQKGTFGGKQGAKMSLDQFIEDWQETRTFTAALEKIESWIFSRMVESVWWQTLTPNMQSPVEGLITNKTSRKLLDPALGDQQHGSFCIDLWKNAFQDAFHRLCPVRAGGHECSCLPVLARMVMEQCVNRLDVAMFNAILRESAHQIPTDPVSDPIVDPRVLPIPAGDLSFGSAAQLKNCVGNWCRWLADSLGMETDYLLKDHQNGNDDGDHQTGDTKTKCFRLLDELSDLLMLPKDLLVDRSIRKEVCPSISLSLVKRILCNFSPDEFCPDDVPGEVLEALNALSVVERRLSGDSAGGFPYVAKPVEYSLPSSFDVAEKLAEAGERPQQLGPIVSMVQRKGYTSDDELDDLDSPLTSIVDSLPTSPTKLPNGDQGAKPTEHRVGGWINLRYELLREAWSV